MTAPTPINKVCRLALHRASACPSCAHRVPIMCSSRAIHLLSAPAPACDESRTGYAAARSVASCSSWIALSLQIANANGHSADTGGAVHVVSARVEQLAELPGGIDKVGVPVPHLCDCARVPAPVRG